MNKKYISVTLEVVVDTDLNEVDDILEHIDIDVLGDVENVNVLHSEVTNMCITYVK